MPPAKNNYPLFFLAAQALLSVFAAALAADDEIKLKMANYQDNNRVTVNTKMLGYSRDITPNTKFTLNGTVDAITGASRNLPVIDGISGASAVPDLNNLKAEYRKEVSAGATRKIKETAISANLTGSTEDDYGSNSCYLSVAPEFNSRNTALSAGFTYFDDTVFPYGMSWTDKKLSRVFDLGLTQVLTPVSEIRINANYSLDDGYLSNPYHRVVISNFYYPERYPRLRDKTALSAFYNLLLPGETPSSLQLDYRYYSDSWNVISHTAGIRYNRNFGEKIVLSGGYRYYTQTAAFFFMNEYSAEQRFMTADPKMGALASDLYTAELNYALSPSFSLELTCELYSHKSNLDYSKFYESISKEDLRSSVIYLGTTYKP
jgi:hypothetical protein